MRFFIVEILARLVGLGLGIMIAIAVIEWWVGK